MLLDWCEVWFFFFKQKTAYEMRISDWSSDVCSSDLERRGNTILLALPAPLPPIGMATTGHAEVRTTPPHPTLTHGANLAAQGYAHLRMGDRKSGARLLAAAAAMAPRSEEHTSELQSLMPISYDVFCLKKKKQHTTPTYI